jgi:hypothetical protein
MENNILTENRSRGWIDVSNCPTMPDFAKRFITEFRTAAIEKRSMSSAFLHQHTEGVEKRSLSVRERITNLPRCVSTLLDSHAATAKRNGITESALIDAELRLKARDQASRIAADNHAEDLALQKRAASFAFEAASQPGSDLDARPGACPAASCSSDIASHEKAVRFHAKRAKKADNLEDYAYEMTRCGLHQNVVEALRHENKDSGQHIQRCIAACGKK